MSPKQRRNLNSSNREQDLSCPRVGGPASITNFWVNPEAGINGKYSHESVVSKGSQCLWVQGRVGARRSQEGHELAQHTPLAWEISFQMGLTVPAVP